MPEDRVSVVVGDRRLRLTNLGKILYPEAGVSKRDVIDYYARVAPVLLGHLRGRPVTLRRYPDGVDGQSFFEKNASRSAPDWVPTVEIPTPGSSKGAETTEFVLVDEVPTLVWLANLAALELHVPQWRVTPDGARDTLDLLVFDLDPGPPATVVECCRVAELLRVELEADGLAPRPKTSGSKGLQLYVPVTVAEADRTSRYARELADRLAQRHPEAVVSTMTKARRVGRVLIDWSQNNPAKTTVAPYSLRARAQATVSTPVTWDEVESCATPEDLVFTHGMIPDRLDRYGDLFEEPPGEHPRL
ncbi:non-homologous end-joining DNA ligase [Actinoalloteichus caeruleus]|uniref:non-homologous end-joining DNA ligase n=1 Tax=Actinoalloteichus cyanogriseus TaxID=2893586 RepID=UPI0004AB4FD8|nr:non-homologous end-joining DNA ligase [Actinoalloteichus caeruleus]